MDLPPGEQDIRNLLGLQGYDVVRVTQGEMDDVVEGEVPVGGLCPHCGWHSRQVHQRAARPSRLLWGFMGQRRLWLVVRRHRLWCPECGRAFTQPLPHVGRRQRVGGFAQVSLLQALKEQSFAALRRAWQVSYGRVRRILMRLPVPWCDWSSLVGTEEPVVLGIDEHSFRGNSLVITVTCLSTRCVLAILPDDRQDTLRHYLQRMPEDIRARVAGVCIDLKASFRSVIEQELPGVSIVADHFHVIQNANRRLDEARRLEQGETGDAIPRWPLVKGHEHLTAKQQLALHRVIHRYPTLQEHHWIKEWLRALYQCPDPLTARERWTTLLVSMEASDDASVSQWARTLRSWRREILAYFSLPITNGFTEGCHTKIKLLKRLSYGYRNVQVYIRKMLLGFLPASLSNLQPHILT